MHPNDKDFLKSQFDKILISLFLILAGFFLLHVMHHSTDDSQVNQSWGVVTFFLGLMSGLITGKQIGKGEAEGTKKLEVTETTIPPSSVKDASSTIVDAKEKQP